MEATPLSHSSKDKLLLSAFTVSNKYNGFYSTFLNKRREPELLIMEPYHIYTEDSQAPIPFSA